MLRNYRKTKVSPQSTNARGQFFHFKVDSEGQQFGDILSKFTFLAIFLAAASVSAEEPECHPYVPVESQGDADLLAMRGVACFEKGEFLQALLFYRQAYEVSESPLLQGGIGRCLQELGYPDLARQYFVAYLSAQDPDSEGHQRILQRLEVVEQTLANEAVDTEIRTTPSNARVYIVLKDEYWEEVGATPLSLKLVPGDYQLILRREDFQTRELDLTVSKENAAQADIALVPQDVAIAEEIVWRRRGVITWIASTPFLAGSAALFVLGEMRHSESDEYTWTHPNFDAQRQQDLRDEASLFRTFGIVSGAIGVVGILTGTILYLAGSSTPSSSGDVSIYVTPNQVGWTFDF